ncbi:MAG: DUF1320 family protein [Bacteroidales bacterium]|nr:DUF1320 family protein [Bacteroidales bacterium]
MSLVSPSELKSHIYDYQVQQITENDSTITETAISTAEALVKSYLASRFDTDAIWATTGNDRPPLVLDLIKTIAVYKLIRLCNVDILYDRYHDAYLEAIDILKPVSSGTIVPNLPRRGSGGGSGDGGDGGSGDNNNSGDYSPLGISSNPKFQHDF